MQTKVLEIRDKATFIPCVAIDMNPTSSAQVFLLKRCGYPCDGVPNIAISHLDANGTPLWNDPYAWGGRTYPVAHNYIINHWNELKDGDVVDVEFILGETKAKKISEELEIF